ncbi:MAG: LacI family DNA-binding transcriptional regulator [Anaerolineae bacterium]|nr:LacI family DNA-binding transcriptional regulator [Anaerolineae bacterium]
MAKRRVTSRDVAERAGVSRTTVSFVINKVEGVHITEETRQRVLVAAQALGYVPDATAQALASRRTRIIGLVFSRSYHHLTSDAFLLQIVDGLLDVVRQHGIRLLLDSVENRDREDAYLNLARAKRIDGIILSLPRSDDKDLRALAEEGFPVVLIGRLPDVKICSVDVDNRVAARTAVEHLLSLGHTRIGCITNAPPSFTAPAERLRGYREALEQADIPFDQTWVRYGDYGPESGFEAMTSLLQTPDLPSAVFVASDVVAYGAMAAIYEHHLRIPDDIAVVGFDDVPLSRFFFPPLTTVRLPAADLGRKAGQLLLDLILHQVEPGRQVLLDTELIVRDSSGKVA